MSRSRLTNSERHFVVSQVNFNTDSLEKYILFVFWILFGVNLLIVRSLILWNLHKIYHNEYAYHSFKTFVRAISSSNLNAITYLKLIKQSRQKCDNCTMKSPNTSMADNNDCIIFIDLESTGFKIQIWLYWMHYIIITQSWSHACPILCNTS